MTDTSGTSRYIELQVLAGQLLLDWDVGAERLRYGQLPDELVGQPPLSEVLAELERSPWDPHGRLLRLLAAIDPDRTPTYRGIEMTPMSLQRLAAEAVREGEGSRANELVRSLLRQHALEVVVARPDGGWARELERRWREERVLLDELLAIQAERGNADPASTAGLLDALLLQLLTDPEAGERLRGRLAEVGPAAAQPAWFRAAHEPDARPGRLLAAALLVHQVERQLSVAAGPGTSPGEPGAGSAPGEGRGGAAGGVHADPTRSMPATDTGGRADPADASRTVAPRRLGDLGPVLTPLVAVSIAAAVAAAALRWPAVTLVTVVAWLVVDRVATVLTEPFLRLVGGWPPTISGWGIVLLPLRLVWLVLRGPWQLLGDLIVLLASLLVVDRLLRWGLGALDARLVVGLDEPVEVIASRWFVPVWAGLAVWFATRARRGEPPVRGAATLAGLLRAAPVAVRGVVALIGVVVLLVAVRSPAVSPWEPYADHREAIDAVLPVGRWVGTVTDTVRGWIAGDGTTSRSVDDGQQLAPSGSRWEVIDASALNVRAGPGTDNPVLTSLRGGSVVVGTGAIAEVDGALWVELVLDDGRTGWASARYLSERS